VSALRKGRFFYIGKGANLRHPVHIDDCLDAMVAAAQAPREVTQRVFNIAGPKWMTVEDMVRIFADAVGVRPPSLHIPRWAGLFAGWSAERVGAITGIEPPISRRTLAFFENDNAFDITAAQGILGYRPRVQLRDGIQKLLSAPADGVQ
jgi:nucleoside-diphosphate-sugar epimerase